MHSCDCYSLILRPDKLTSWRRRTLVGLQVNRMKTEPEIRRQHRPSHQNHPF
jgi:hypothetical protein